MNNGEWSVRCTGIIERITLTDMDKSGRNPRHHVTLSVRPESIEAGSDDAVFGELVDFGASDSALGALGAADVVVGQRVVLVGAAHGVRPRLVLLRAITVTPTEGLEA